MTLRKTLLAAAVAALMGMAPVAVSAQSADTSSLDAWTKSFMDPQWADSWTGSLDIADFTRFMSLMTNPAMMQAMTKAADPAALTQWMSIMTNPAVIGALAKMGDPTPYLKWMSDPEMIAALAKMGDPTPYMQMLTNAEYIKAVLAWADPAMMNGWITLMTDVDLMETMAKALSPELMSSMMISTMQIMGATGNGWQLPMVTRKTEDE